MQPLRCRTDLQKTVLLTNFEKRGWERWLPEDGEEEWNVYWATVGTIRQIFAPDSGIKLQPHQRINHFPNHVELTRKDLLVKNWRRYRKELEKELGDVSAVDFIPVTHSLPADMALFQEEYRRNPKATWILKPASRAQGRGIFLVRNMSSIKKWAAQQWPAGGVRSAADSYVISRYIDDPLLVCGKKFDIRMYVLVTSYRPLRAWISDLAFCRFCTELYERDDLENTFVHLTNVAIQKHGESYNDKHGSKWPLRCLKLFLEGNYGGEATERLFERIRGVVLHSLKAVQRNMINDRHCFELYGYDLLIDADLKPWLLEVNASPSLTCTTEADRKLKQQVIWDALAIGVPADFLHSRLGPDQCPAPQRCGSFQLLVDEANPRAKVAGGGLFF